MPAHAHLDHPHVNLTLDFIVLLLGNALLLLADPISKAAEPCNEGTDRWQPRPAGAGPAPLIESPPTRGER
jgi:hypothetical protein